jgi:hypothetical protein
MKHRVKIGASAFGNEPGVEEMIEGFGNAPRDQRFDENQKRNGYQEARVSREVAQQGYPHGMPDSKSLRGGEDQKRDPREKYGERGSARDTRSLCLNQS